MKEKTRTFFSMSLVLLSLLGMSPARPQATDGLRVELDALYLWAERGKVDAGDRTRRTSLGGGNFTDAAPRGDIDVEPDSDLGWRFELEQREDGWGAGLMGWWFDADGTETYTPRSDAVGPPFPDLPGRNLDGVFVPSLSGVNTVIGNNGFYQDSALTRMEFKAENDVELWKADVFGLRELVNTPRTQLDFLYGLELVDFDNERSERVRDVLPAVSDPGIVAQIDMDTQRSSADWEISLGGVLGLQGALQRGRHRFAGTLLQSLVYADVDMSGRLTTGQRQRALDGSSTGTSTVLDTYSAKEGEWVPITELKLQYLYELTERFSVGGGGFLSVFWDAPVAPAFNRDRDETIAFVGLMLSAQYRFGTARKPVTAAAPAFVPPPPPAPPVAPAPYRQSLTLSAQTTFGFDDATLDADARRVLDRLAAQLQDKEQIRIRVAGHACRLGPESYNQGLSERRAEAVGRYLEDKAPAADIQVEGCGEANPLVTCDGLAGQALRECLAPNRRTEIEVTATELVTPVSP